jgi:ABC-type uncharacterized transport system permease subunit
VNIILISLLAILVYTTAAVWRFYLVNHLTLIPYKEPLLLIGLIALALHGLVLYESMATTQGLNLGIFNAASLVMWVIILLIILTLMSNPLENLTIILFPLAALTIGAQTYFYTEEIIAIHLGMQLHVVSSILAYSLLSISAFQSLFLAIQDYQLHHKHPGWIIRALPPLQVMEILLFRVITIGVFFLSLSLVTGTVFLENIFAQHLVHKTVLSIIAWWIFAILLWGHWHYGWRGRTAIRWNLIGFFTLMLAYFGSKLVLELILKR